MKMQLIRKSGFINRIIHRAKATSFTAQICLCLLVGISAVSGQTKQAISGPTNQVKLPKWNTTVSLGFNLNQGNSETTQLNASARTEGKFKDGYSLILGGTGSYGEVNGSTVVQRYRIYTQLNRDITDWYYLYFRADHLHDDIADIDYRSHLSPGVGFHVYQQKKFEIKAELGPGFHFERKGGIEENLPTARAATLINYKFNEWAAIRSYAEYRGAVERFRNYYIVAAIGLENKITKRFSSHIVLEDYYVNEPAAGFQANDLTLYAGLTFRY